MSEIEVYNQYHTMIVCSMLYIRQAANIDKLNATLTGSLSLLSVPHSSYTHTHTHTHTHTSVHLRRQEANTCSTILRAVMYGIA